MPRKPNFKKRPTTPDSKFSSVDVALFINRMMTCGKKSLAERLFYSALDIIETKIKDKPSVDVFRKAVENQINV